LSRHLHMCTAYTVCTTVFTSLHPVMHRQDTVPKCVLVQTRQASPSTYGGLDWIKVQHLPH